MTKTRIRHLIPIIALALLVSGCTLTDQLADLQTTQQVQPAPDTWTLEGNTYTATVDYEVPSGEESNTFTITVNDAGVIQDIEVDITTQVDASVEYQQDFAQQLDDLIVGQKVSDLEELDIISGASITTKAFNNAVKDLQLQLDS